MGRSRGWTSYHFPPPANGAPWVLPDCGALFHSSRRRTQGRWLIKANFLIGGGDRNKHWWKSGQTVIPNGVKLRQGCSALFFSWLCSCIVYLHVLAVCKGGWARHGTFPSFSFPQLCTRPIAHTCSMLLHFPLPLDLEVAAGTKVLNTEKDWLAVQSLHLGAS